LKSFERGLNTPAVIEHWQVLYPRLTGALGRASRRAGADALNYPKRVPRKRNSPEQCKYTRPGLQMEFEIDRERERAHGTLVEHGFNRFKCRHY